MSVNIFYAWQSDRPEKDHHYLIRDALQDAIDRLKKSAGGNNLDAETTIDPAPAVDAPNDLELDHDIKGVGGTPDIAETIRGKIRACSGFVADVTFVGAADGGGSETTAEPKCPHRARIGG